MKLIIYRDKATNKIISHHNFIETFTDEMIQKYNENDNCNRKAECVEFKEDSLAYYFYWLKINTANTEAENLRCLMSDLQDIANRIDDRLYDFDRLREENGNNEQSSNVIHTPEIL